MTDHKQWLVGVIPCMPGFVAAVDTSVTVSPGATELYYMSYIYGLLSSGLVYAVLHRIFPAKALESFVRTAPSARELRELRLGEWDCTLAETPNVQVVDEVGVPGHRSKTADTAAIKTDV